MAQFVRSLKLVCDEHQIHISHCDFFMSRKFKPAELCLSKCYFLWNNEIRIPSPIGLSFMVVLSENYVQNFEHRAIGYR